MKDDKCSICGSREDLIWLFTAQVCRLCIEADAKRQQKAPKARASAEELKEDRRKMALVCILICVIGAIGVLAVWPVERLLP